VVTTPEDLPNDIAALQAALLAERAKRIEGEARTARVEAELAVAKAKASDDQALITHQQLQIAKLTRELYGQRSERRVQLLDQMALAFEDWRVRRARTRLPPSRPSPRRPTWWPSSASARRASPSPSICRASE
jgi:transposase